MTSTNWDIDVAHTRKFNSYNKNRIQLQKEFSEIRILKWLIHCRKLFTVTVLTFKIFDLTSTNKNWNKMYQEYIHKSKNWTNLET